MSCFQGLFFCPEAASLLLHNFCIYHISPPGHEVCKLLPFWIRVALSYQFLSQFSWIYTNTEHLYLYPNFTLPSSAPMFPLYIHCNNNISDILCIYDCCILIFILTPLEFCWKLVSMWGFLFRKNIVVILFSIYAVCLLEWCSQLNIEYVEACASNADFDKCKALLHYVLQVLIAV